ncbi:hypothetical protein VUR80DRAFT_10073 [Thermomyces stellatus]
MNLLVGITLWVATALAQANVECTKEMVETDDCAAVINPAACYNMFQFRGRETLSCIEGTDDADRARKACACCSCVGERMCTWAAQNNICNG